MEFILNDRIVKTDKPGGMTLLDFIRYNNQLTGTKIGCREGDCGACTILMGELENGKMRYQSMTSCITPLGNAIGKHIVTIEGLNMNELSPVQKALVEFDGSQCGFCTVGFIVSLSGYCMDRKAATTREGIAAIDGNICRCTGYKSIERAVHDVTNQLANKNPENPMEWLVEKEFIPAYFLKIPDWIAALSKYKLTSNRKRPHSPVGGGTDLYVQRPEELVDHEVNGFLNKKELKGIGISANGKLVTIGASSTVSDLLESAVLSSLFPDLRKFLKLVSSTPIRNMATLAGNFVNASPIGDMTIFFLALNSSIRLQKPKGGARNILLKDFYKGYKTLDKHLEENIISVSFETPGENSFFNFEKVSKRTNLDIASVNSAVSLKMDGDKITDIHLSAGGVGPVPLYLEKTSGFLRGRQLTPDTILEAANILQQEISPISDARGSREYKALLQRQIFFAHFIELFPDQFEMDLLV